MNILVTGAAGFIGSNFVRYWAQKYPNDKIVIYDKLTYAGNLQNLKGVLTSSDTAVDFAFNNDSDVHFVKGDICDIAKLRETVNTHKIDTIVHFAAETHVDRSIDGPAVFVTTNVIGTHNILEVVRENPDIRLHHISTDEVFGDLPLDKPEIKFTEDSPYNPRSPYSASKAGSDHLVRAYIETFEIKATISNCSNNFGPYYFPEKLIPLTITRALNDQEIPVYGTGEQVRDWIHTYDHVCGVELILQKGKLGDTYLLGGNSERQNIAVVKSVLQILGKPESLIVHVGDRKGHDHRYAIDYSKAECELGFSPVKSFDDHLAETVEWYVNNTAWWQPLKAQADVLAEKYLAQRL